MSCLPIVSDSCDRREQVFRVGAAAPRVFNSKYLLYTSLYRFCINYQKEYGYIRLIPAPTNTPSLN